CIPNVADSCCTLGSHNLWLHRATRFHSSSGCARAVLCANCSVLLSSNTEACECFI
ncbi:hypothetical protein HK096_009861, partial [Nowakowskiella sp. JEL0078]